MIARSFVALVMSAIPTTAAAQAVTVLYDGRVTHVEETLVDPNDLWVLPEDLPRVNDFELKPEGACLDELCVPVLQDRDGELLVIRSGQKWFNATELARKLQQPFVADHAHGIWSLGEIPATRTSFRSSGVAPDFELSDREGRPVRLSEFRGKKVLLITWASW